VIPAPPLTVAAPAVPAPAPPVWANAVIELPAMNVTVIIADQSLFRMPISPEKAPLRRSFGSRYDSLPRKRQPR
jgi:hypothetical protein